MKWLMVLAFPAAITVIGTAYFLGFHAIARRLMIRDDSPWVPLIAVGSFVLALYLIAG